MSSTNQTFAYADLATFPDYDSAQTLVDRLSDGGFDVEHVRIVGNNLRSIEQVTGRLTAPRAAAKAAASGAWFGLFIGGFATFFSSSVVWIIGLLAGLIVGAIAGAIYGAVAHAATHGRRDFSSIKSLEPSDYTVMVETSRALDAARLADL